MREASCHVCAFGNDYHAATFGCSLVDKSLNLGGVYASVGKDAVVGEDVLLSKTGDIHARGVKEPGGDGGAVWPKMARVNSFFCER